MVRFYQVSSLPVSHFCTTLLCLWRQQSKLKKVSLRKKITSKNILTSVLNYTIRTSFSQLQPASRHPREYQIMDWKLSDFPPTKVIIDGANHPWVHLLSPVSCPPGRGGAMGGGGERGGQNPPKDFKKGENEKNMGYFQIHTSELLKLAFLSSFMRKYVLWSWKGFYHDFSTKKASASGGFAPWPPPRSSAPGPPRFLCPPPPNDLPWRCPCPQPVKSHCFTCLGMQNSIREICV